ncbi:MAG: N-6 DNA methylase [Anaerolineaceae bacterium]|nr:N-6 DNA methylase [Anaerolineaceae bacterium]
MTHSKQKQNGVVYTPAHIVDLLIVNVLPFLPNELSLASICDPACGDGAFLVKVAEYVLKNLDQEYAMQVLRRMAGCDIDEDALFICKKRLNELLDKYYPNERVEWDITRRDVLDRDSFKDWRERFTHIVGNPPYVRVQHLEQERRDKINGRWKMVRGATDLYILFYELALDLLCERGFVGYITPSSWFRSDAGSLLRKTLLAKHRVWKVIDFGKHQVFPDVTTYTSITVIQKRGVAKSIPAEIWDGERLLEVGQVVLDRSNPSAKWWVAKNQLVADRMKDLMKRETMLGDIADIHVGIQTLADSVFIVPMDKADELSWEHWILKDIVKASVMKDGKDPVKRVVIFPYDDSGALLPEDTIAKNAPRVYQWLLTHKERLLSRDKGKIATAKWYAFGRSVSILSGFGEKILTSGMNKKPNFQRCMNSKATFYSGYCIKPKSHISIDALLPLLNSSDMDFFIQHTSRPYQGGWMSYAKSFIENYPVQ